MLNEKKYCAAPWRGLHLNFDGQIKTCCAAITRLDSVLGSDELLEVKQSLKKGILHKEYCKGCIDRENAGANSERDWHNNLSQDFDIHTADLDEHTPSLVDIRWTNTCNLACTYCSPYFSTKWASIIGVPSSNSINKKYQEVINYINRHKDQVKEVALVGGEPLLMKENADLLDILPDNVLVTVISNMTVDFTRFPVPKKLLNRSRVGWSMSFDNIGKRFEYVRWGSTWERLNKNITVVSNKINNTNHHGGIHAVYNLYNCTRICELKEYADSKNLNIVWQRINGDHLDPCLHNNRIKQLALDEIKSYRHRFKISNTDRHFLDQTEKNLILDNQNSTQKFLDFTHDVESKWHPDQKGQFVKLWPELAEAL